MNIKFTYHDDMHVIKRLKHKIKKLKRIRIKIIFLKEADIVFSDELIFVAVFK